MEMEKLTSATCVLVIPFPVQGHINPMLQFSKRLIAKGLQVTVVLTTSASKSLQTQSSLIDIETIPDTSDEAHGDSSDSIDAYIERYKAVVVQNLPELIRAKADSGSPVKVLVFDSVIPWVIDIAHELGLKGASFFTQSAAVCATYYHFHKGEIKVPHDDRSTVSMPAMPPLQEQDLPSFLCDMGASYPSLYRIVLNQNLNYQKADWLLFNTFDKLEQEVISWMESQWPIKAIGPTVPSMYLDKRLKDDKDYGLSLFKPNAEACTNWLDSKEAGSVAYVSFGSLANLGKEQMEELAWGLVRSNCYFLWVVRAPEETKLPTDFRPEKGLIVNWCPQLEVLAHKAIGCFMTHCGWNSTLEALSSGVPMVAMPQWTDQTTNAKFIVDVWHAGLRVKANENGMVNREEVAACIREVMQGEKGKIMRKNAVKWKELAKEAVDEGGSSDRNICDFVSQIS